MVLDFFYLESQPQPSLGKLEEADFTLRVGYLVRSRYAFVRSASALVTSHVLVPPTLPANTESQNTSARA